MLPLVTKPLVMIESNIFARLSYNKENNTFLNRLQKNDVEALKLNLG